MSRYSQSSHSSGMTHQLSSNVNDLHVRLACHICVLHSHVAVTCLTHMSHECVSHSRVTLTCHLTIWLSGIKQLTIDKQWLKPFVKYLTIDTSCLIKLIILRSDLLSLFIFIPTDSCLIRLLVGLLGNIRWVFLKISTVERQLGKWKFCTFFAIA